MKNTGFTSEKLRSGHWAWLLVLAAGLYLGTASCSEDGSVMEENQRALTGSTTPSADTYVRDGVYSANNYGHETTVKVRKAGSGYNRWAYFKFDTSSVSGTLTNATLVLYGSNGDGSTSIEAYPVPAGTWTEAVLTWTRRVDSNSAALATTLVNTTEDWYYWDVTSYVNAERAQGRKTVAFLLKAATPSNMVATFHSREAVDRKPYLSMNTGTTTGSQTSFQTATALGTSLGR